MRDTVGTAARRSQNRRFSFSRRCRSASTWLTVGPSGRGPGFRPRRFPGSVAGAMTLASCCSGGGGCCCCSESSESGESEHPTGHSSTPPS
uniref:Uncharacterized protein n=1 Tax=Arundo donax TaxID=35708 RepID=A0A0A8Y057_ARUDO